MNSFLDYPTLSAEYAAYHRTAGNQRAHMIGIPLIVYAIVSWTQVGSSIPFVALILPVYFSWDRRVGWLMTGLVGVCATLALALPGWTAWAAFIIGWGWQIYGHKAHEKNSPALFDNLAHSLIGPAFVVKKLVGMTS